MAFEDFTTYTEVDEQGEITVTVPKVEWVNMDRDVTSYVYKDFGVGHFGEVDHDIEIQFNTSQFHSHVAWWVLTNLITEMRDIWINDRPALVFFGTVEPSAGVYRFYLMDGETSNEDFYVGSVNTLYYCTITRIGTTFTVKLYSDSDRLVLVDTLTVTCTSDTYRYLYACMSIDEPATGENGSGFSQNFDLQEAVPDVSAGIKIWDGTGYIELVKDNTSPVRIWTGSEAIGVKLVNPNHANTSAIQIFDGTTIKTFKKKV